MCTTASHDSIVSATTGCPAEMTDNNDPDGTVMASVFPGDRPMSFVAEVPLTVIAPAGYNNDTATVAVALPLLQGQQLQHVAPVPLRWWLPPRL